MKNEWHGILEEAAPPLPRPTLIDMENAKEATVEMDNEYANPGLVGGWMGLGDYFCQYA